MNYKSARAIIPIMFLVCIIIASCTHEKRNAKREYATTLYYRSVSMIKLYTDSMMAARDSITVLGLSERLNNQLTVLNFDCPSDTDLEITEGENDTLMMLTDRIVNLRDSLLYRFAHPLTSADSLAADSVAIRDARIPLDSAKVAKSTNK